jgi:Tfp pilus assembly protein PilN
MNFARRPFRNEQPVIIVLVAAFTVALLLLVANVSLYAAFQNETAGTARQIESLERRRDRAVRDAAASQAALDNYKVSSLAQESRALLKLVAERRFSWTGLLARLERTLPADVRLTRLTPRFDDSGETYLDCALVGRTPDAVVRTITALSKDPSFSAVDLRSEAGPEAGTPEGFAFELYLKYRPAGAGQ